MVPIDISDPPTIDDHPIEDKFTNICKKISVYNAMGLALSIMFLFVATIMYNEHDYPNEASKILLIIFICGNIVDFIITCFSIILQRDLYLDPLIKGFKIGLIVALIVNFNVD